MKHEVYYEFRAFGVPKEDIIGTYDSTSEKDAIKKAIADKDNTFKKADIPVLKARKV